MKPQRTILQSQARRLRRNQTDAERKLWFELRNRRFSDEKFRRQHPIAQYVVDFCCPERDLIIELDGGQHATRTKADQERTVLLQQKGYRVLRFWNHEVIGNMEAVLQHIEQVLKNPHPNPLWRHCVGAARFALPWQGEGGESGAAQDRLTCLSWQGGGVKPTP